MSELDIFRQYWLLYVEKGRKLLLIHSTQALATSIARRYFLNISPLKCLVWRRGRRCVSRYHFSRGYKMLPSSVCWGQNAMHHIDGASIDW